MCLCLSRSLNQHSTALFAWPGQINHVILFNYWLGMPNSFSNIAVVVVVVVVVVIVVVGLIVVVVVVIVGLLMMVFLNAVCIAHRSC